jgi:hypothetical protein
MVHVAVGVDIVLNRRLEFRARLRKGRFELAWIGRVVKSILI